MTYQTKVNKCKPFLQKLYALEADARLPFQYNGKAYHIHAFKAYNGEISYSVWSGISGMNVSKVGNTSLKMYTYDMMGQRTTYSMSILKCTMESVADKASVVA